MITLNYDEKSYLELFKFYILVFPILKFLFSFYITFDNMIYFYIITILLFYFYENFYINEPVKKILLAEKNVDKTLESGKNETGYHAKNISILNELEILNLESEDDKYKKSGDVGECASEYKSKDIKECNGFEKFRGKTVSLNKLSTEKPSTEGSTEEDEKIILNLGKITTEIPFLKKQCKNYKDIDEDKIKEFDNIIKRINNTEVQLDFSSIKEFLRLGISDYTELAKMKDDYPIYMGPKIDFRDLKSPFGTMIESLKETDEITLSRTLFFDNFLSIDLNDFLVNTKVGNLSLEDIYSLYILKNVNYLPYNNNVLKYLSSKCTLRGILMSIPSYISIYLEKDNPDISNFNSEKFNSIHRNNIFNISYIEKLKIYKRVRYLSKSETLKLKKIIAETKQNMNYVDITLQQFEVKRKTIYEAFSSFVSKISPNNKYISRDEVLISCIYYIMNYCLEVAKPLYEKIKGGNSYSREYFISISSELNSFINIIEFLEHNSKLYNDFYQIIKVSEKHYPRATSEGTLKSLYNYLILKTEITAIIYNICKISAKVFMHKKKKNIYYKKKHPFNTDVLYECHYIIKEASQLLS